MADTDSILILWCTNITHQQFQYNINLLASSTKQTTMLLIGCPYGFKSITSWLISLSTIPHIIYTCATHWLLSKDS